MNRSEWKQYILETYHAVSDRPWPRYPNHGVFRHPGNRKWFALMLEVPGEKLGLPERGMLDILNLKCDPVLIASLRGAPGLLPADYAGPVPAQMQLMDVPAGEYLVFEHGPFDFETQNAAVEAKIEQVMRDFDYAASGWQLDLTPGRVFYFYHDCARFFKYVRPVCRA